MISLGVAFAFVAAFDRVASVEDRPHPSLLSQSANAGPTGGRSGPRSEPGTPAIGVTGEPPEMSAVTPGMSVASRSGEVIGKVAGIDGNRIMISVGQHLGMGTRVVSLYRGDLVVAPRKDDADLRLTFEEEVLAQLPDHPW